jgi:hypothetical protein
MAVDERIPPAPGADEVLDIHHPFRHVAVHGLLGDELVAAAGNAPEGDPRVHVLASRLVLEAAGEDVHLVAEPREAAAQFQHVVHLSTRVGLAQFRLRRDVAVDRDHHDSRFDRHSSVLP